MINRIRDLELSVLTQKKLSQQGINLDDDIDDLLTKLSREELVSLYGEKSTRDILHGFYLVSRTVGESVPAAAYHTTEGVEVIHRTPCRDHPDTHYVRVGKIAAHGRLVIDGPDMSVTLHHNTSGAVVGVEIDIAETK